MENKLTDKNKYKMIYFYKYGRYRNDLLLVREYKIKLLNKTTNEIIVGINNINKYLEINNIEFEVV